MSQHSTARRVAALVGASAVLVALAGVQHARRHRRPRRGRPGVTDDTVTIGTHTPLTGPAAAGYSSISAAATAYFDYLNENGGVHGRDDRVHRQGRRLQPGEHADGRARARAGGRGLRDPERPRHADPHRGARLPEPERGARPVRRVGLDELEPAREVPVHVRVQRRLRRRGRRARAVRRRRVPRQDRVPARAGRRLRRRDDRGRRARARRRRAAAASSGTRSRTRTSRRRSARSRRPAARSTSWRPSTASRRWRSAPPRSSDGSRCGSRRRRARTTRRSSATSARTSGPKLLQGFVGTNYLPARGGDLSGCRCSARSTTSTTTARRSTATPSTA